MSDALTCIDEVCFYDGSDVFTTSGFMKAIPDSQRAAQSAPTAMKKKTQASSNSSQLILSGYQAVSAHIIVLCLNKI